MARLEQPLYFSLPIGSFDVVQANIQINQIMNASSFYQLNFNQDMEEMEAQFTIPIERSDGVKISMEVRHRNSHLIKRKVKTWTNQEDQLLLTLYQLYPKKWSQIASQMIDRNQNQCLHRYRRISQSGSHKKIWSSEEDQTVNKIIKKVGKNWKLLSKMLGTKTGKQIRQRFINKLDPKIKKQDWTDEEDRKIIELYSEIGRKWSEISKHLPGRPENKIKNRYYSYIQKNYEIKYKAAQTDKVVIIQNEARRKEAIKIEFSLKQIPSQHSLNNEAKFQQKYDHSFPSIHQIELDLKFDDCQDFLENRLNSKVYLQSLLKVEEEWGIMSVKYRMDDFSGNLEDMQCDLFYLSHL